jgi:hypothetical protein
MSDGSNHRPNGEFPSVSRRGRSPLEPDPARYLSSSRRRQVMIVVAPKFSGTNGTTASAVVGWTSAESLRKQARRTVPTRQSRPAPTLARQPAWLLRTRFPATDCDPATPPIRPGSLRNTNDHEMVEALTLVAHGAASRDPPTAGSPNPGDARLMRRAQLRPETELINAPT